jgi:hypothetical protein
MCAYGMNYRSLGCSMNNYFYSNTLYYTQTLEYIKNMDKCKNKNMQGVSQKVPPTTLKAQSKKKRNVMQV